MTKCAWYTQHLHKMWRIHLNINQYFKFWVFRDIIGCLLYITFQIILRLFKSSLLDASFVDFVELLGMLIKKAYPYLWFELQAHSSFYLRGLTLCVPQKVCFVLKILYGNWFLKHFPQYSHFKSSNTGETIYQGLFSFSVCWIQSCFESS